MEPLVACKSVDDVIEALKTLPSRTPGQEQLLTDMKKKFPKGGELALINAVAARVPTFLYFDQYLKLPGIMSANEITNRKGQGKLTRAC